MSFAIGENVGAYRIMAQLGQGGMATVFKGYHPGLDRYVAIKVMHSAFKEDDSFLQRFNREARIVARLEHPNIVPVYDFSEHRGLAYLVMRFVDGETLKARLKRGALRPDQIAHVASLVGAALGYAHQQGVLHRDIKPSNILLTTSPEEPGSIGGVFLTDFGLARMAEAGESTLSRDMMVGTPQYISPEQAKGVRELDAGTDIYSLGVVLFELVTGRVPFSADTPYSVIHDHIFTPLPLPTSINPDVSETVQRVLLRALAKEPGDRYVDVESFVSAYVEGIRSTPAALSESPTVAAQIKRTRIAATPEFVSSGVQVAPPPAAETLRSSDAEQRIRKRKKLWLYAGIPALLLLCLGAVVLGGWAASRWLADAPDTAEPEIAVPHVDAPGNSALAETIARVEEQVAHEPQNGAARAELAFLYLEAGAVEAAEQQMRAAVELRPEEEWVYLEVGRHLVGSGQRELAAEVYVTGLEVLPESRALRTNVGMALWALSEKDHGNPQLAEELTRRLVDSAPDDPLYRAILALVLMGQGKMDEAKGEIDTALALAPRLPEAHLVNGIWLRNQGRFIQARREFGLALESSREEWLRSEINRQLEEIRP
jgi:serine/threonine protein kinase/Tfp pilus assembly protein PilF